MKPANQIEVWKSLRKAALPPNHIERPCKGGGYRRHPKYRKQYEAEAV